MTRQFRFLSSLDWTRLAGWDVLVRAYVEEFGVDEDVSLVLSAHSSLGYTPEHIAASLVWLIQDLGRDPERIPDLLLSFGPAQLVAADLRGKADCVVVPSRAELPAEQIEAAASGGLPAMATAWGAPEGTTAARIAFELREPAAEAARETPHWTGRDWAEPDVAHLRKLLRSAFERRGAPEPHLSAPHHAPCPPPPRRRPAAARPVAFEDVSFVVQGPIERSDRGSTARTCRSIREHFPGAEIVVSTWSGAETDDVDCDRAVLSDDPGRLHAWNCNTNRQIVSTLAGIRAASRPLVAKLRSDLVFHGDTLLDHWGRWEEHGSELRLFKRRVLVPNVFMRRPSYLYPLPHHPSDWSFFGTRADLELLFDIPLLEAERDAIPTPDTPLVPLYFVDPVAPVCAPEQYIWVSALRKRHPDLRLDHSWDLDPGTLHATEAAFANNFAVLDTYTQYGLSCPKYPDANRRFEDFTLYQHEHWLELYELHCLGRSRDTRLEEPLTPGSATEADLRELRMSGRSWEAMLIECIQAVPGLKRDMTTGGPQDHVDLRAVAVARAELAAMRVDRQPCSSGAMVSPASFSCSQ